MIEDDRIESLFFSRDRTARRPFNYYRRGVARFLSRGNTFPTAYKNRRECRCTAELGLLSRAPRRSFRIPFPFPWPIAALVSPEERIPWIGERRAPATGWPPVQEKPASLSRTYVSYVTPDRLSIYRDRARKPATGCEIRSIRPLCARRYVT